MYNAKSLASTRSIRADFVVRCSMEDTSLALCSEVMDVFDAHGANAERLPMLCQTQYEGEGDCPACGIGGPGDLRVLVKDCTEADLRAILADLQKVDVVCAKPLALRIIE